MSPPGSNSPYGIAASVCPRCSGSSSHPFSAGGVCLRCAGERVLALDLPVDSAVPAEALDGAGSRSGFADDLPLRIGPYEIIEEIGHGGMGRVFAARQAGLGRIVALKALPEGRGGIAGLELRFPREAQTAARLRHPHIVSVHESGRADGFVYFSMDYLDGGDLARRLRERPFSPREAAAVVQKLAAALAYTHGQGVLHRDVKPSNVLLDGDEPRLADFGLAAQLEPGGDLTTASGVIGTPHYVAPEALRGGSAALSASSDLYALGVVLYEMLTGRTAFAGAAPLEVANLIASAEPPAPHLLAPAVPRDLETICLKCLERDPARRYPNAAALGEDLRRFLAGEPIVARPVSGAGRFVRWCRRRPTLAIVWLLVTTIAIGSTLAAAWIAREQARTKQALKLAESAGATAREHLREARLAEARAVRRTTQPGRRTEALAALEEAARIRPGLDVRNEALAALILPDIRPGPQWDLATGVPGPVNFGANGQIASFEAYSATGSERSVASVFRWGEKQPFAKVGAPGVQAIGRLRFSADGKFAMMRYVDDALRVWRVGEASPLLVLRDRPSPDPKIATEAFNDDYDFSPDATRFALGVPGGGVSVHRLPDGAELARWAGGEVVNTLRFSPDGKLLALAADSDHRGRPDLFVVEAQTGALRHAIDPGGEAGSVAWSADSRALSVTLRQNAIVVYDVRDGRLLQRHASPVRNPGDLTPLAGGLASVRGTGTTVSFIDQALGQEQFVLDNISHSPITPLSDASAFVVSDALGLVTRWTVLPPVGFRIAPPPRPSGYEGRLDSGALDFSPDGRWVVTSATRFLLIRDVASGRLAGQIDDGESDLADLPSAVFSPDGRAVIRGSVARGLRRVPLEFLADGTVKPGAEQLLDAEKGLTISAVSADGRRLALVDNDHGTVKIVELTAGGAGELSRWTTPDVYSAAFSPDGERVLVNCAGVKGDARLQHLRVHNVHDGAVVATLPGPVSCDTAWSPEGGTALTSNGQKRSVLWDTKTWRPRAAIEGLLGGNITTFVIAPDGRYAVIARDRTLHLVSTQDGAELAAIEVPSATGDATAIRFVPGRDEFAVLWRDGRIDFVNPVALRRQVAMLGLAW